MIPAEFQDDVVVIDDAACALAFACAQAGCTLEETRALAGAGSGAIN